MSPHNSAESNHRTFLPCLPPPPPSPKRSRHPGTLPLCSPATESTALPPLSEPTLPPWSAGEVRRVEPSVAAVLPSSSEAGAERVTRAVTGTDPSLGRKRHSTLKRTQGSLSVLRLQKKGQDLLCQLIDEGNRHSTGCTANSSQTEVKAQSTGHFLHCYSMCRFCKIL